jgi:hypothetical protein
MNRDELTALGLTKAPDGDLYRVSGGQNGRIILGPIPWEEPKPLEADPIAYLVMRARRSLKRD